MPLSSLDNTQLKKLSRMRTRPKAAETASSGTATVQLHYKGLNARARQPLSVTLPSCILAPPRHSFLPKIIYTPNIHRLSHYTHPSPRMTKGYKPTRISTNWAMLRVITATTTPWHIKNCHQTTEAIHSALRKLGYRTHTEEAPPLRILLSSLISYDVTSMPLVVLVAPHTPQSVAVRRKGGVQIALPTCVPM